MDDFNKYIQKLSDNGLTTEQVAKHLDSLGIPYKISNGEIVEENPVADFTCDDSAGLTILGSMSDIVDSLIKKDEDGDRKFNEDVFNEKKREFGSPPKVRGRYVD